MNNIICPVCNNILNKTEKAFKCINNHSFDIAKQGYLYLLLANQKNSKNPGDDKDMIQSRRDFLEKGLYKNISNKINNIVSNFSKEKSNINICDVGCGEGYYTNLLKESLDLNNINNEIIGIDISKPAILFAAKKYKKISWVVASALNLPIKDDSMDISLLMFTKIIPDECYRILKKDSLLIVLSTGEDHLLEIKEVVYKNVKKDFFSPIETLSKNFNHIETINIKYEKELDNNNDIKNLFDMTPYRWKSPKEGVEKLFALNHLNVTIDVNIDIFTKKL